MENEPKFLYSVDKGTNYVTDKVFVHKGHVVIVPSWPLTAGAVIMTLSIEKEMEVVGKFLFENEEKKRNIDQVRCSIQLVREAAVSCSPVPYCAGGVKLGSGTTG